MSNKRKTNEEFIQEAHEIHGRKYDYSNVNYINRNTKITITCKIHEHGDFLQAPQVHLRGMGCPKCGGNHRMSNDEIINKFKLIHGNLYDYSNVNYKKTSTKVKIVCKIHGPFLQSPASHLKGSGCPKCGACRGGLHNRKSSDNFEKNAIEKYGNKFDYSNMKYINCTTPVTITCKMHGDFSVTPAVFLKSTGVGCPKCNLEKNGRIDKEVYTDTFFERCKEIHTDEQNKLLYNYPKTVEEPYLKIKIECPKHGIFKQAPYLHVKGHGCPKCARERINADKKSKYSKSFIEKAKQIHVDLYDYSKVDYEYSNKCVEIICKKHGSFFKTPDNHIHVKHPQGCPVCANKTENKLYKSIVQFYPNIQTQFKQEWCKKIKALPFDFCIPEHNIIIELDGPQHFIQISNWDSPEEQLKNDKYKEKCANDNGYSTIRVLQKDVYNDTYEWLQELRDSIEEIKKHQIVHGDEILNIYLGKEYDKY